MKRHTLRRRAPGEVSGPSGSGQAPHLRQQSILHSLRLRLPLLFGVIVIVMLATFLWATYRGVGDTLIEDGVERSRIAAEEVAGTLTRSMASLLESQRDLVGDPRVAAMLRDRDDASRAAATELLLPSATPIARRIEVWDTAGELVLEIATVATDTAAELRAFPSAPTPTAAGVSALGAADSAAYFTFTLEVRDTAGAPLLGYYRRYGRLSASAGSLVTNLLGDDVQLRIGQPGTPVWTDLVSRTEPPPLHEDDFAPGEYRTETGHRWVGASAEIEGTPWIVWFGYPRSVVVESAVTFVERMSVVGILFILATMVLIALLGYGLTNPLHALTSAAEEIAAGDYGREVAIRRRDEIGRLGAAFNIMSGRVKSAHAALRDINQLTNFALAAARIGVWEADLASGRMTCSDSMALVRGLPLEDLPETREDFLRQVHDEDRSHVRALFDAGTHPEGVFDIEYRVHWPDGSIHWIEGKGRAKLDDAGRAVAMLGVSIDVTDRRRLESQFRQSQKMEAVGQLAGGVAHDFNNLLTAIIGHGDMLLGELPDNSQMQQDAAGIMHAAESAARLTRQLLTFSRRTVLQPEVLSPNDVISRTESLLRRLIPTHIELRTELARDLPAVRVDPSHLEQIIINLAVNARDAMPHGGHLVIATERAESSRQSDAGAPPAPHALIRVTDTGAGMDAETQARVFEPFFTTKPAGLGTGLGLATVFGIVQQSGGAIDVQSSPGRGTTFRIWLPAVTDARVAPTADDTARPPGGTERILIVEDDPAVRSVAARMLRAFGYTVDAAASGEDALRRLSAGVQPDLVITDVMMPGMTGHELFREINARYPNLRVMFTSGYAPDAVGIEGKGALFIEKPYTADAFASRVRDALEQEDL